MDNSEINDIGEYEQNCVGINKVRYCIISMKKNMKNTLRKVVTGC